MLLTGGRFKGLSHVDIYYIMPLPAHAKKLPPVELSRCQKLT